MGTYNSFGWNYYFNGLIDDLFIYNRALNNNEVSKLYNFSLNGFKSIYTNPLSDSMYNKEDKIKVSFSINDTLNYPKRFYVLISDEKGHFTSRRIIGEKYCIASDTISVQIPNNLDFNCNTEFLLKVAADSNFISANQQAFTIIDTTATIENLALQFDGEDDYLDLGDWFNYDEFSISYWLKPSKNQQAYATLIDNGINWAITQPDVQNNQYIINSCTGPIEFYEDKWYYFTLTYKEGILSTFLNSKLFSRQSCIISNATKQKLLFSTNSTNNLKYPWKGAIDDLSIWNRELTLSEISKYMHSGITGDEENLEGYWNFDSCDLEAFDYSGNKHYGQLNGRMKRIKSTVPKIGKQIIPDVAGNVGEVSVKIFGNSFKEGAKVKLTHSTLPEIEANSTIVSEIGNEINCIFSFIDALPGLYNIEVVSNSSIDNEIYPECFTIEEVKKADIYTEIVGRKVVRNGRWSTFSLQYGNRGNIDAHGVPIWFAVSADAEVIPQFEIEVADDVFPQLKNDDFDYSLIEDSFLTDTVLGEPFNARVYALYIVTIPAGYSDVLSFRVKPNSDLEIKTWAGSPYFGSPLEEWVPECYYRIFELVLGLIPKATKAVCISEAFDAGFEVGTQINKGKIVGAILSALALPAKAIVECVLNLVPAEYVTNSIRAVKAIGLVNNIAQIKRACTPPPDPPKTLNPPSISSFDPNELIGPSSDHLLNPNRAENDFTYTIYFENKDTAKAAAQEVFISDNLQKDVFMFSNFEFKSFSFSDTIIPVDRSYQFSFEQDVDLRPLHNLILRVEGVLDTVAATINWKFSSLDPETMELTEDPIAGFLPPNVTSPQGEGFVSYSICPKTNLASGMEIRNKAKITFDLNEPIWTNEWVNIVDKVKPTSKMLPISEVQHDSIFSLRWSGKDIHSDIMYYNIYVSENNKPFEIWQFNTSNISAEFHGRPDSTYSFYCEATDYAGNKELKSETEVTTIITLTGVKRLKQLERQIQISPNPSDGLIKISTTNIQENYRVQITDIMGKLILEKQVEESKEINIDFSAYQSGIYLFKFYIANSLITKKVLIK